MQKLLVASAVAAATFFILPFQAQAEQSGLAGMHAQAVFKGRRCFTEHTHVGTGSPARSKRHAIASAAGDWSSFTAFEYGSSWASWRWATGKKVMCEKSAGSYTCEVHARPCLGSPRRRLRQARR